MAETAPVETAPQYQCDRQACKERMDAQGSCDCPDQDDRLILEIPIEEAIRRLFATPPLGKEEDGA